MIRANLPSRLRGFMETLKDTSLANILRVLSVDAIEAANSGHPGMPMGMADIATVLWRHHMSYDPVHPDWINRDRFVLSNGHGAMLLYSVLHLTGYKVSLDDLKNFRQSGSITPGHPEYGHTPGVETTTGPLGQGFANAVGMALAEKLMAKRYNKDGFSLIDHNTFVFLGDGCLMEGISQEAASLAGTLGLSKLVAVYDDNGISIDGEVKDWFKDDTPARFRSCGWDVIDEVDGHDQVAVAAALEQAKSNTKPTLICCQTQIGYGSPNKVNTAGVHGAALGAVEVDLMRDHLVWPHKPFEVPKEIAKAWDQRKAGAARYAAWQDLLKGYQERFPDDAKELLRRVKGELPKDLVDGEAYLAKVFSDQKAMATRKASLYCIEALAPYLPELFGGSADLSGSNCTKWSKAQAITPEKAEGNYCHYGVREFGMAAMANGMACYGGFIPFVGTFLVFSDYARNAIRLSAMMKQKVIYVLSHDSIGLGEDGPTHQPIEHAASLRLIPGLHVWRPADSTETATAWESSLGYQGPSALLLSRQNCPALTDKLKTNQAKGGYVLSGDPKDCAGLIIATGSELELAVTAAASLEQKGIKVAVVSMPCVELFLQQTPAYRQKVLPPEVKARVAVEAGVTHYWLPFVGDHGEVIGVDDFGASAPYKEVYQLKGVTAEKVEQAFERVLKRITI